MSAQPLESRLAHVEGVVEQIVDRLNGFDRRFESLEHAVQTQGAGLRGETADLRSDMNSRFAQVDQRLTQFDQKFTQMFTWSIGITVTSWTTVMLAILFKH